MLAEIEKLSVPERLQLMEEIWNSIVISPADLTETQEQLEEIDRRVEALYQNSNGGKTWEQVKAKMVKP